MDVPVASNDKWKSFQLLNYSVCFLNTLTTLVILLYFIPSFIHSFIPSI